MAPQAAMVICMHSFLYRNDQKTFNELHATKANRATITPEMIPKAGPVATIFVSNPHAQHGKWRRAGPNLNVKLIGPLTIVI